MRKAFPCVGFVFFLCLFGVFRVSVLRFSSICFMFLECCLGVFSIPVLCFSCTVFVFFVYWFLRFLCVGKGIRVLSSCVLHTSADTVCMRDRIVHTGSGLEKYESAYIHKKGRFAFHKTSLP